MVVFSLLIINKAGGLIYNRTFSPGLQKISSNDALVLAGTFHGIHAISKNLAPAELIPSAPRDPSSATSATPGSTANTSSSTSGAQASHGFGGQHHNSASATTTTSTTTATSTLSRRPQTTGIQTLESGHFRLTCFQTPTGTKMLLFTSPEQPNADVVVRRGYEIFADQVLKNPFYGLENPVRVEKFDHALDAYLVRP